MVTFKSLPAKGNKNNRGQLKIQQMAFMLMAVTLFLVLAGMFMLVIKYSGLKDSATLIGEQNAISLVTRIANSPDFACGNVFGMNKINCIDADKAMIVKAHIDEYKDFWGSEVKNIEIRKIYPLMDVPGDVECEGGHYFPDCNVINMQGEPIEAEYSNFVSLCRKETSGENKCDLAKIMVSYEKK